MLNHTVTISDLNQLIYITMTAVELILFSSLYLHIYFPHILDILHGGLLTILGKFTS